jgi:hypothetical protein
MAIIFWEEDIYIFTKERGSLFPVIIVNVGHFEILVFPF